MGKKKAEAKEIIFKYGDEADLFYFILDGVVELWVPDCKRLVEYGRCSQDI